jgi:uncharacterized iron-regulated membrane protein
VWIFNAMRQALLYAHRYVGLTLAAFLIVIGITGSIIVFFEDLDLWANAELRLVSPQGQSQDLPQDLLVIREQLERAEPTAHFFGVHFPEHANEAAYFYTEGAIDPVSGEVHPLEHDQVYVNPYTGKRLGHRLWGDVSFERKDLFTFIYFLHYSLILPETWGEIFMGIVALAWAVDCVVALYLTFPGSLQGFWQRWKSAWQIKLGAGKNRAVYDLHRASGLWLWLVLLLFAWSGFSFNMPRTYRTVMSAITHIDDNNTLPMLAAPLTNQAISWQQAHALGKQYMAEQAQQHQFTINRESMLLYRRETGVYDYRVNSSRDIRTHQDYGYTSVAIDATTGALRGVEIPSGQNAGNTFTTWIKSLHTAVIFGWPLKIFNCFVGLMVTMLSITGVLIWLRKRRSIKQATA